MSSIRGEVPSVNPLEDELIYGRRKTGVCLAYDGMSSSQADRPGDSPHMNPVSVIPNCCSSEFDN